MTSSDGILTDWLIRRGATKLNRINSNTLRQIISHNVLGDDCSSATSSGMIRPSTPPTTGINISTPVITPTAMGEPMPKIVMNIITPRP